MHRLSPPPPFSLSHTHTYTLACLLSSSAPSLSLSLSLSRARARACVCVCVCMREREREREREAQTDTVIDATYRFSPPLDGKRGQAAGRGVCCVGKKCVWFPLWRPSIRSITQPQSHSASHFLPCNGQPAVVVQTSRVWHLSCKRWVLSRSQGLLL